jgi:hypothetical protein
MKYTIETAHWRVPSEARAFDGWLEGSPTPDQRAATLAEVARRRETWTPNSEAWGQLRDVERFIGQRVCIQFWDPIMFLLEDEGPYPVLADCQGIALLRRERFLQAYLILDRIEERPNVPGYSPARFLERDSKLGWTLAPIAEVAEIEDSALPAMRTAEAVDEDRRPHPPPSQGDHHPPEEAAPLPRSAERSLHPPIDRDMANSEYFDTRTLQPAKGQERACPVRSCKATLQRRHLPKRIQLNCPDHEIEIRSKTFIYKNPLRNIRFECDFFERAILNNPLKAETHRFGNENSEDALTWNVFAALAKRKRLSALSRCLSQIDNNDEPELYLWGLRVSLDDLGTPKPFDALCEARNVFESDITRLWTEPDIIMYAPKRFLILVEAKFTSGNPTAGLGANDVSGDKPKTPAGILNRYRADRLPPGSLRIPTIEAPLFSQLYRNLVFAIWMAAKLNVEWRLVNLTSKLLSNETSNDLTTFINAVLPPGTRQRFVRYTWEQLFRAHVEGIDDLHELATYLRFKSANCGRAFDM